MRTEFVAISATRFTPSGSCCSSSTTSPGTARASGRSGIGSSSRTAKKRRPTPPRIERPTKEPNNAILPRTRRKYPSLEASVTRTEMKRLALGGSFRGETYAPPTLRQNLAAFGISLVGLGGCALALLVARW